MKRLTFYNDFSFQEDDTDGSDNFFAYQTICSRAA